jgi:hypothetical protein
MVRITLDGKVHVGIHRHPGEKVSPGRRGAVRIFRDRCSANPALSPAHSASPKQGKRDVWMEPRHDDAGQLAVIHNRPEAAEGF